MSENRRSHKIVGRIIEDDKTVHKDGFHPYLFSYRYKGSMWSFVIQAESFEDAQARMKALGWAKLDGRIEQTIPASNPILRPFISLYMLAYCGFRNLLNKSR